jgi:hypothetical protein
MTIWRRRFACQITKSTNTQSEYVKSIAFPLQQWLYELHSALRSMKIACIVQIYLNLYYAQITTVLGHLLCNHQNRISF